LNQRHPIETSLDQFDEPIRLSDQKELINLVLGFFDELLHIHSSGEYPGTLCEPMQRMLKRERVIQIRMINGKKRVQLSEIALNILKEHKLLQ
jgi:hypothetical protein